MDLILTYAPACAPDAQTVEIPPSPQVQREKYNLSEASPLLHCTDPDECQRCARKKRRLSLTDYTAQPTRPVSVRRKKRGCTSFLTKLKHLACCCQSRRRYQLLTRYRYHKQKKPYSSITVHVENLTSETYDEDDLAGIPDLIEVVRLQATGPTEVARALRKKLKYGNVHRQLRALTILDGLLQNGGPRLQRTILSDGPLLERLRIAAVDPISDIDVRAKCKALFGQWVASSKDNPGLEGAKSLYNQLPKKARAPPQQRREQSKVLRETEEDVRRESEAEQQNHGDPRSRSGSLAGEPSVVRKNSVPTPPAISLSPASTFGTRKVKKEKKNKNGKVGFNLEKERPAILQCIAGASVASTNLNNALKLVNREDKRVSDDPEVMKRFETCKALRRQILRYIQFVETDELLGGLIHANEELVESLMAFEVLDKSVDDDSDSELEEAQHLSRQSQKGAQAAQAAAEKEKEKEREKISVAGLSLERPKKPPRPVPGKVVMPSPPSSKNWRAKQVESDSESETGSEAEDDDNPFGDRNAMKTPDARVETGRKGYTWKEV
jgi:LAS seventeen-binding protein 5